MSGSLASAALRFLVALVSLASMTAVPSCLEPTEIVVEIRSNVCGALGDVDIFLGDSTTPSAVAPISSCDLQGKVGTIVFVPSGKGDAVVVRARAAERTGSCTENPQGCIEVKRVVQFVRHARTNITLQLDSACVDAACNADETCDDGNCVPNGCSTCPLDASPDANDTLDGGIKACKPPWFNSPTTLTAWHFEETIGTNVTIADESNRCFGVAQIIATGFGCGHAATLSSGPHALGCDGDMIASSNDFHVAFWMRLNANSSSTGTLVAKSGSMGSWQIVLEMGQPKFVTISGMNVQSVSFGAPLSLTTWHSIEIRVEKGTLNGTWVDGSQVKVPAILVGAQNGAITIGRLPGGVVDELYVFR